MSIENDWAGTRQRLNLSLSLSVCAQSSNPTFTYLPHHVHTLSPLSSAISLWIFWIKYHFISCEENISLDKLQETLSLSPARLTWFNFFFFFFLSFKWKQTGVNAHSWWLVKHAGEICGFLKKVMMFQQPLSEVSVPVTTRDKHLGKLGDKNKIHIASV